jgi:hypothetical protein
MLVRRGLALDLRTRIRAVPVGIGLILATVALAGAGQIPAAASGPCSKATASALVNQDKLNDFLVAQPVVQVLCGPFTGPGSRSMLVTIAASTCWGVQQWAVFRHGSGGWQLITDRHVWLYSPVVAAGGDFRVTSPISRAGDPFCNPSGGKITRTWHWNGRSFVIVATTRKLAPPTSAEFYDRSLSRGVGCEMDDAPNVPGGGQVVCESFSSTLDQNAKLHLSGPVVVCSQRNPGTTNPCDLGNLGDRVPTYGVGRQITVGRFRCRLLTAGVQCTVSSSGRGFLFGAQTVTAVGGATVQRTSSVP